MNVYLYGGNSRFNATKEIVDGNEQPLVDTNYTITYSTGMFLIAYPNENKNSNFEFEYWVDGYDPSIFVKLKAFLKPDNNWLVALLALLLLIFCLISLCCCCSKCKK